MAKRRGRFARVPIPVGTRGTRWKDALDEAIDASKLGLGILVPLKTTVKSARTRICYVSGNVYPQWVFRIRQENARSIRLWAVRR